MRLHIISDLHLEFSPLDLPVVDADVVVAAGDIHKGHKGLEWLRRAIPKTPVIYVLGNHEYYGHALPRLTDELRIAAAGTNVHVLENAGVDLAGVTFLGATLWTDFALDGDAQVGAHVAEKSMNDFRLISTVPGVRALRASDMRRVHDESVGWLRTQLAARRGQRTVVVTHHLPSPRSIAPRFSGDPLNPAFASNLDELVASSGAELWVHGHSHTAMDYRLGDTRVIANPRGYPHEIASGFNPRLVIDISV
jgi:predicted phosphodiesterase